MVIWWLSSIQFSQSCLTLCDPMNCSMPGLPKAGSVGKNICLQCLETWIQSLGQEDPLEKGLATHSSILAWRILWIDEPGGLQSMGSQRVRHN